MTSAVRVGASFSLALFLVSPSSQLLAQNGAADSAASDAKGGQGGFPVDMIRLPAGKVEIGSSADELIEVTKEFHPRAPRPRLKLLQKLLSELGETTIEVDTFYLHRTLVTNEQYLQFVRATKRRFPFHWWKEGKKDDWASKRAEYNKAFQGQRNADLLYWERYWDQLPYAIPEGEEQLPVIFVSWIDAQAFAGWAGMRLPTEAEWLYAASGGKKKQYLWGDEWSDDKLKDLRVANGRDQRLRPVGELGQIARGPFGHDDMVGNAWEWVVDVGYFPVCPESEYKKELRKLRKNKFAEDVGEPDWSGAQRVLKGGSYFSWQSPAEFRINTRASMGRTQTVEGASFRVAKSLIPARDMCRSRISVEYDASFFGGTREPNLADQIGIERYDLANGGKLITDYHALAVVPVSHMGLDRGSLDKAKEESRMKPMVIGTLITTEALAEPKLEPGMYTIYFREKGSPKELQDALREGSRLLIAEQRSAKKGKAVEEKDTSEKSKKGAPDWRAILAKYGITDEEAAVKNAQSAVNFVRVKPGDFKVTTDSAQFLFRKNSGEFVAVLPTSDGLSTGSYKGGEIALGTKGNKEAITIEFGSPWSEKSRSKNLTFSLDLQLTEAPDVTKPWHTPKGAKIEGPHQQNGSRNNLVKPERGK